MSVYYNNYGNYSFNRYPLYILAFAMAVLTASPLTHMAVLPSGITIPVLFFSVPADLVIIGICLAIF